MRSKTWTAVSHKLPSVKTKVELKRDLSVGAGGFTGREQLEWVSSGSYTYYNDMVQWRVNKVEGLTLDNSRPTHWR